MTGQLSVLEAESALGQEPQTAVQRIAVADRQLETQAASAWGLQGTLFFRSLRWSDNSRSRIPVMWISQAPRLEITFFEDFNVEQYRPAPPHEPQIIQLRLPDKDKVFHGAAKETREELFARAQSACQPDELAGRLQLGEWAESWAWGREQTAMGVLLGPGPAPSARTNDALIAAEPLAIAALLVCTKLDGLDIARSNPKEHVVTKVKVRNED